MQSHTFHPPAALKRQEWGMQTSAPSLRAIANLKLSESRCDPSDETGKALSQSPTLFLYYNIKEMAQNIN